MVITMMIDILSYNDYDSYIPTDSGILGSITTTIGHSALRNGWKVIEVYDRSESNQQNSSKSV